MTKSRNTSSAQVIVRQMGLVHYAETFELMKQSIAVCRPQEQHEMWIVQHPSIFTQGQAGNPDHLIKQSSIDCLQADRGGQITYHGPGQLVCYLLFDLKQLNLNVKQLVDKTTRSVVGLLQLLGINAHEDAHNPGVYVDQTKIASLGFRIRKHMSYHGVAINHAMDLRPFQLINPCGRVQDISQVCQYPGCEALSISQLQSSLIQQLTETFGFDDVIVTGMWPARTTNH